MTISSPANIVVAGSSEGPSSVAVLSFSSMVDIPHRERSVTKRKTRLPSYRLTGREHFDMVVEHENYKKSQQKKEKGKKCSGTESEQAEEEELKIAKTGKRNANNSSGSIQSTPVRNSKGSGGQMPKKAKKGDKTITSSCENYKKSQQKKEKGKKRSGTESERAEEYELKIAKRGKINANNSSGSIQSTPVRNSKGSGGQMPKKAKRKAKKGDKTITSSSVAEDHTPCKFCGKRFNMPEDDKPEDDWIMCSSCKVWAHETCGEKHGIIGDDEYICINCA